MLSGMIGHLVKTHVHMCSTRQAVVDVSDSMPLSGHARRGPDVCFLTILPVLPVVNSGLGLRPFRWTF